MSLPMEVAMIDADEDSAPALWLVYNVFNKPRRYKWLGESDPEEYGALWFGWSALMDAEPESYNGESVPGYVNNAYPDAPLYVEIPCTTWGDYCGDDIQRSNNRVLMAELEPYGVVEARGDFGHSVLMIPAEAALPMWILNDLKDMADDYPVWSDSDHSDLQVEIQEEDWNSWGRDDFRNAIVRASAPWSGDELTDEELDSLAWESMSIGDLTWEPETAVSGYFRGLEDLAKDVAENHAKTRNAKYNALAEEFLAAERAPMPGQETLEV